MRQRRFPTDQVVFRPRTAPAGAGRAARLSIKGVRAKLCEIRVTDANLSHRGAIALDPEPHEAVGTLPLECVEIWSMSSGARIRACVICGERGSRA